MRSSLSITITASSESRFMTASIAWSSALLVRSSVESVSSSSSCSWSWKSVLVLSVIIRLSEAPGDVVLGARVAGIGEDLVRRGELDELAVEQECGRVRDARRLLHVVGHDRDRVTPF